MNRMTRLASPRDFPPGRSRARSIPLLSLLCAAALGAAPLAACSGGDDDDDQTTGDDGSDPGTSVDAGGDGSGGGGPDASAGGGGGGGGGGDCEGPFGPPRDPGALPACCADIGGAHCVPADSVDPAATGQLAECEDGASYCVPDVWIEAGGDAELVACASVGGADGVCLSQCIPLVAENAGLLPQDICADTEKCVPCINPLDGVPTGACELDLSCGDGNGDGGDDGGDGDGGDGGGGFEACCDERGTCIPGELAGDQADSLDEDTCTEEGFLCAPDPLIDGSFVAEPCESTIGGLGGNPAGACVFDCLARTGLFLRDGCDDGFKCVACELPLLGETGACDFLPGN